MSTYLHFYNAATGLFSGISMHTNLTAPQEVKEFIARHTPAGHGAYVGHVDALSQKVDLASGRLVDHRPPQPSGRHEWNPATRRWQLQVGLKRSAALTRIAELEQGQHRSVRETLILVCHALDALQEAAAPEAVPVRAAVDRMYAALARLERLDTELVQLRAEL